MTSAPAPVLYQRDDCHLCDAALDVLAAAGAPEFESVSRRLSSVRMSSSSA